MLHQEKTKGLSDSCRRGTKMNTHLCLQYNQKKWWEEITISFYNQVMSRTVSVCEYLQTKNMKQAHFGILFALFLLLELFLKQILFFFRCETTTTGNIYGQITPRSACSIGIRSVPIRNFSWSCTYKKTKPTNKTKNKTNKHLQ